MAGFEDKISELLNSPEGLEKVLSVAKMLAGDLNGTAAPAQEAAAPPVAAEASPPAASPSPAVPSSVTDAPPASVLGGGGGSPSLLSQALNAQTLGTITKVLGELDNADDHRVRLFTALKPFLNEKRGSQIENAILSVKLAKAARVALKSFLPKGE